uniref:HepT-like ribonuclease domain-containing protein n=1 Tax=Candidatus Electrothrix sp. TaxID=2170559 RepID=UPI00405648B9
MDEQIKKYLYDIHEAISSIFSYLGEKRDFNLYLDNKMLRRAVEREFEIIGEAMNRINKRDPNISVSHKMQIISMRNRVIHGYDKIDDAIVWGVIVKYLPLLQQEIETLLALESEPVDPRL